MIEGLYFLWKFLLDLVGFWDDYFILKWLEVVWYFL